MGPGTPSLKFMNWRTGTFLTVGIMRLLCYVVVALITDCDFDKYKKDTLTLFNCDSQLAASADSLTSHVRYTAHIHICHHYTLINVPKFTNDNFYFWIKIY